jgi:hypothetical protein
MKSISPVVPGFEHLEIVVAKNQPEYEPLPALPVDDAQKIITRWRFSWRERLQVLFRGDLYLWVWTFRRPVQPVFLEVSKPDVEFVHGLTAGSGDDRSVN